MTGQDDRLSANPYEARRQRREPGAPMGAPARKPRRTGRRVVAVVVVLLLVVMGGWGYDRATQGDKVARNTTLDARTVGGLTPAELQTAVGEIATAWDAVPVAITTPAGKRDTTLAALGVHLDRAAVTSAATEVGRSDGFPASLVSWWKAWTAPRSVPLSFTGDAAAATSLLADLEAANHKDPIEAKLSTASLNGIVLVPAEPGATLDAAAIHQKALDAARSGQRRITIDVGTTPLPPRFSDIDAARMLDEANQLAERRLGIYVGDRSITVDRNVIGPWLSSRVKPDGSGLEVVVDQERIEEEIPDLLGEVGTAPVQIGFTVDGEGNPQIVDGKDGTRCCAPDSAERVTQALRDDKTRVDLDLTPVKPDHDRAWAEKLQIVGKVGEFTTPHNCCENRVTNIHLFADIMRGKIIEPGKSLSLNEAVGERTEDRGFVVDHAIVDGKYVDNVGGGVSQFAATTFNAAFFAGLDIPTYQMHTIAISRYPYGREATISWGGPDLVIKNITPYGILIWPTYTDTSLTVTLYSTPFAIGEQTNQTKTEVKSGDPEVLEPCTRVTTERTRTFLSDLHTSTDTFSALYQPDEGKRC